MLKLKSAAAPKQATTPNPTMFSGLITRVPIYNRKMDLFGYELKFGGGFAVEPGAADADRIFAENLLRASREVDLQLLTGPNRALIRLAPAVLPICEDLAWPRERIILALPEPAIEDHSLEEAVSHLADSGFTIAVHNPSRDPAQLQREAEFVSICTLDASNTSLPSASLRAEHPAGGLRLMVRKLETADQYDYYFRMGFDYYEGGFFNRPRLIRGCDIPADRLGILRLIARLQDPNVQIEEVESLVSRDITLSYKLLRLINAAYFGMPKRVDSIRRAVVFFGLQRIRNWATVILVNAVDFHPRELLTLAMVRGRLCELVAQALGRRDTEGYYVSGLFSMLDALMDAPLDHILSQLNLAPDLVAALLEHSGPIGEVLQCVLELEQANTAAPLLTHIARQDFPMTAYLDAIRWAHEANAQIAAV